MDPHEPNSRKSYGSKELPTRSPQMKLWGWVRLGHTIPFNFGGKLATKKNNFKCGALLWYEAADSSLCAEEARTAQGGASSGGMAGCGEDQSRFPSLPSRTFNAILQQM